MATIDCLRLTSQMVIFRAFFCPTPHPPDSKSENKFPQIKYKKNLALVSFLVFQSSRWESDNWLLSSWCLVTVGVLLLCLTVPWVGLCACLWYFLFILGYFFHRWNIFFQSYSLDVKNNTKELKVKSLQVFMARLYMSHGMRFPTIWHFDKCRLGWATAASF